MVNLSQKIEFNNLVCYNPLPNLPPRGKEQILSRVGETGKGVKKINMMYITHLYSDIFL